MRSHNQKAWGVWKDPPLARLTNSQGVQTPLGGAAPPPPTSQRPYFQAVEWPRSEGRMTLCHKGVARLIRHEIGGPLAALSLTPIHSPEAQAGEVSTVPFPWRGRIFEILKSREMVIVYVRLSRGWMCG